MSLLELAGQQIAHWSVIRRAERRGHHAFWVCECRACGHRAIIASQTLRRETPRCAACVKAPVSPPPRSTTEGAPRYSFRKPRNTNTSAGKLHRADVNDVRRWATRDGYGMSVAAQARYLQATRFPLLHTMTLEDILQNRSFYDPAYDRETPHPDWGAVPTALLLLLVLRRMYTLVDSPAVEVGRDDQLLAAQREQRVLDGALVEAGRLGQRAGGADLGLPQGVQDAASA
jgi:hypothetical protein